MYTDHSPVSESIIHGTTLLDCQTPLMFYLRLDDIIFLHFFVVQGSPVEVVEDVKSLVSASITLVYEQSLMMSSRRGCPS
jgi:hypothetical protein